MASEPSSKAAEQSRALFVALFVLCLVGLAASIELTVVHFRACHDLASKSFCAFNEEFDCDAVARSDYAVLFRVPVSVWGIVGYLIMALVALWGWRGRQVAPPTGFLLALTSFSLLTSAVLGTISALKLSTICVVCVATYVVNAALLVLSVLQTRRVGVGRSMVAAIQSVRDDVRRSAVVGLVGATVVGLLIWRYPQYRVATQDSGPLGVAAAVQVAKVDDLATGVTDDGHHWIGAVHPELVIEEFSDYECPFCEQAHWVMRALVAANPDEVRLVHRHFPLDNACNPIIQGLFHTRSCGYAAIAACAGEQKKFWQANDYLFTHGKAEGPFEVSKMCSELGIDLEKLNECVTQRAGEYLEPDLREGISLKITGTPTFKINGKLYTGELPMDLLKPYLVKLEAKLDAEQAAK